MLTRRLFLTVVFLVTDQYVFAAKEFQRQKAPKDAVEYIVSPTDGETVKSPFVVRFGLTNMGVAPAGTKNPATGHHHLIIDANLPDLKKPIPADANHKHFGGGQTEATVELPKGTHTLQLLLGDDLHVPFDPVIASKKITVTVQ